MTDPPPVDWPGESEADPVEALAAAAHHGFCDGLRAAGYRYGDASSVALKTHSQLKAFSALTRLEQDGYRQQAAESLRRLAAAGYTVTPMSGADAAARNARIDIEWLAEVEHEHWLRMKLDEGWRYAAHTDHARKVHSALTPWRSLSSAGRARLSPFDAVALGPGELSEAKREVVRDLFRGLPELLSRAGLGAAAPPDTGAAAAPHASTAVEPSPRASAPAAVFISARSVDYEYARTVFEFLGERGVRVFFSQESLPALGVSDYRRQIDDALDSCTHMVVVTSAAAHVHAGWVEAEWGFFVSEQRAGRKQGNLIVVATGPLDPAELPPSLRGHELIPAADLRRLLGYVR